jgi:hypothetical protein
MKSLLDRYQVVVFFALKIIISWFPWYTGGHGFFTWGPSLAGLIVVVIVAAKPTNLSLSDKHTILTEAAMPNAM